MAGYAKFMKLPDGTYGARLELKDVQNPNRYQKFICTGKDLYQFEPEQKKIMVNALPARQKNQAPDDGPLPFLFGMKADVARQRYDFEVLEDKKNPAAAQWYTYLSVIPKDPRDRADFTTATLSILNKATPTIPQDMPAQIRWIEPNKNQVTWNIKKLERNGLGPANRADFARPEVPAGWQLVQAQPAAAGGPPQGAVPGVPAGNPRVIRNQNPN
jgi:TIGR03009 family protein